MTETKRYRANPDVSCRDEGEDEGAILFNPDTDAIMVLNPVGLLVWRALQQPRTRDEIVTHLLENCDGVPLERVHADLDTFFLSLQPGGFISETLE